MGVRGWAKTLSTRLSGGASAASVLQPAAGPQMAAGSPQVAGAGDFTRDLQRDPAWVGTLAGIQHPAKNVPDDERIGDAGTIIRFGRIQREEFNLDLENEKGIGDGLGTQGVFDKMRRTDPDIKQSLSLLKLPMLCTVPKMEPGDETPLAAEIAEFVAYNLFELNPWQPTMRQTLLMYEFGFSTFELLFGNVEVSRTRFPNLPHTNGPGRPGLAETVTAVGLTAIDLRHPKTIYQWAANPDRPTQLAFVVQRLAGSDTEQMGYRSIPADRLLRFTHDQEGGNFAGVSVLRAAYKPWKIKEELETIDAIRHERQNNGIAKLECPEKVNTKELDKLEQILAKIGSFQGSFLTLPYGYKFSFETSGSGEGTKVELAIDRCIRAILSNICAGFMSLGNGDTGSYAMADVQRDAGYEDSLEAGARLVETGWNHGFDGWSPIKRLIDANYGPQAVYPRLRLTNLRNGMLTLMAKLMVAGGLTTDRKLRNYIRANLNLPPEGEIDLRQEDDERGIHEDIADEYAPAPEEGPPGKTPMTPVPGDATVKPAPGTIPGAPAKRPAPRPAPAAPAAARARLARQLMHTASQLLAQDGGAP